MVPPHSHHAIQIALAFDHTLRVQGPDEEWRDLRGAIVLPDVTHSFDGCDSFITPAPFELPSDSHPVTAAR